MKIETKILSAALGHLSSVVGHGARMLPILTCVRLSAANGTLTIDATGLAQSQTESVEADGLLEPCCVDYKALVMALAGVAVDITQTKGNLLVKSYLGTAEISTLDAEEFHADAEFKNMVKQGVNCQDLAAAIKSVDWCAAKPNQIDRPSLQAVHVLGAAKSITVEATNGRNLAATVRPAISSAFELLIPDGSCRNLCAAMERAGAVLSTGEYRARVDYEGGHYAAKQIDGRYPNTAAIVGGAKEELGTTKSAALLEAFQKLAFYMNPAKTEAVDAEFFVTGISLKMPGRASSLDFNIEGVFKEYKCWLNVGSFLDAMNNLKGDTVKISRNAAMNTIVLDSGDLSVHMTEVRDQPKKA